MTSYTATVTLDLSPAHRAPRWLELLAAHSPAVAVDDLARAQITITVDDDSPDTAAVRAQRLVLAATGPVPVVAVEVMTTAEFDRRIDRADAPTALLSTSDVATLLNISRQRVQQLHKANALPRAVTIGNTLAWPQDVILAYAESRKQTE